MSLEITHPICCGIDVHKDTLVCCLRTANRSGELELKRHKAKTTTAGVIGLRDWLVEHRCPIVAVESTGNFWKPVHHILSEKVTVVLGNACDIKNRPGKKTDQADAEWIAQLLAHDLIAPSFVPGKELQALREMTRTRAKLVQERVNRKNHINKILQDANLKLSSFASDILGVSGRSMIEAMIAGERDVTKLANLAKGRLRNKKSDLELALDGFLTDHHIFLFQLDLNLYDAYTKAIEELETKIEELMAPLANEVELLKTIPGIHQISAYTILAEIGPDMERFQSAGRLCSWAGVCPGNNESAGKRFSGRTRKGNRYLRRILIECAWGAKRTGSATFLGRTYRRLEAKLNVKKKAAMAIAHKILTIVFHVLSTGAPYDESRYDRSKARSEERQKTRMLRTLNKLGYDVELTPRLD